MNIPDYLSSLNEKLKSGDSDDVKKPNVISEITNGNLKLLNVIESLGEVLVNEDKKIRERGVDYLSWVLTEIPSNLLNEKEINVVMNFYCDRLKDHHSLIPAVIRGLLGCVKMKGLAKEGIIQMLTQLFHHINCRTQLPEDRYLIFSIFKFIVENNLEDIRVMGPDLVFGIISFADGETDPKNLLLLFEFLPIFLEKFELGHLTEEMFEMLSCYFPIDFNTATKNNVIITREDLSSGLLKCLSSTRSFSEFSIPLALEKLDSTLKTAKIDSYKLLQQCFKTYGVADVEKYLTELKKTIQRDVLPGNEKEIRNEGLQTLSSLVKLLSSDENNRDIFYDFLNDLLTGVKSLLNNVTDSLFVPAMNVLIASSKGSDLAARHILKNLTAYYKLEFTKSPSERKILISSLLPFLKSGIFRSEIVEKETWKNFTELLELFIASTDSSDAEVRRISFVGLRDLVPCLNEVGRKSLYVVVVNVIKDEKNDEARNECLNLFRTLAEKFSSEIMEIINSDCKLKASTYYLDALSKIADLPNFTNFVIPLLINTITNNGDGLVSLLNICQSTTADFHIKINSDFEVIGKLTVWCLDEENENSLNHNNAVCNLSKIIAILIRSQNADVQQEIVNKFLPTFLEKLTQENELKINYRILVNLLESILGSIRQNVTVPYDSILTSNITSLSLKISEESVQNSSFRLLSSFVNKWPEKDARVLLDKLNGVILTNITDESVDLILKSNSAKLFTWIVKGIILRGLMPLDEWIGQWFDLLNRSDVGNLIAVGFSIVLDEDELFLNLNSHCNVKILYRQRLFTYFPKLVQMYQTSSEDVKINYLLALARLIQGLPKHIILTEISSVVILLIQSLQSDNPEILTPSLEILTNLLEDKEKIFSEHIQSFVDRLLKLSKFEGFMKIRIQALKCLFFYGFYPTELLLPFKQKVVRELEPCVDDKKRLVRNEAVKARSRWYLVGAPGEDDIFS